MLTNPTSPTANPASAALNKVHATGSRVSTLKSEVVAVVAGGELRTTRKPRLESL
jgi:hypothetical protein